MSRPCQFLVIGLLAAGCGPEVVGAPDETSGERTAEIIGGAVDTGDPAVVLLFSHAPNSQSGALCTAEVISPTVLVTAAHCVDPTETGANAVFQVFLGSDWNANGTWVDVKEVHHDNAFNVNNLQGGHDIGIVILTAPLANVTPIPVNTTAITAAMAGQSVRLVGYGLNNSSAQSGAGTKRQATTTLDDVSSLLLHIGTTGKQTCSGDSGGAALMKINGVETLVGVTSFGNQNCTGGGWDTRLDDYQTFIGTYVTNNNGGGGGGGCTPSCNAKSCGSDGCGGSCGTCGSGSSCSNAGQCVANPKPNGSGCANGNETEPNDDPSTANAMCSNGTIHGTIGNTNDSDWFSWTVAPNKTYTITLSHITQDYGMVLYKVQNGQLAEVGLAPSNHDHANQTLARSTSTGGSYYLLVGSYDGSFDTSSSYQVNVAIQ